MLLPSEPGDENPGSSEKRNGYRSTRSSWWKRSGRRASRRPAKRSGARQEGWHGSGQFEGMKERRVSATVYGPVVAAEGKSRDAEASHLSSLVKKRKKR